MQQERNPATHAPVFSCFLLAFILSKISEYANHIFTTLYR